MKKLGLLVAFLFTLLAFKPITPAQADHPWGHWGHGYSPLITYNLESGLVKNAISRWYFVGGFHTWRWTNNDPNNPGYAPCDSNNPVRGQLQVCWIGSGDPRLRGAAGIAWKREVYNPGLHMESVVTYTCVNCGYSYATMDRITTHEVGHSTGLNHTGVFSSMRWDAPTVDIAQHEKDQMCAQYNGHFDGSGLYAARCFQ